MLEPLHKALPLPLTPLIGREQEIATLTQLLRHPEVRLLTILGPGGIGKTRLALQIASDLRPAFVDGLLFVPLETISDPELVTATIAHVLGLHEEGKRPLIEQLQLYLVDKQCLLLLDNFEQLIAATPALLEILRSCPEVKIVVTSRTPLRVQGEHEFVVPLFPLPDLQRLRRLTSGIKEALNQNAALRLFVQRAKLVNPTFELTDENVVAIVHICIRVDGLPLAIELAAARTKLFSPQALLVHLNTDGQPSLALLTSGPRDLPVRQQTLRSTIEWSYRLLSTGEQRRFRHLAVFAGGFTWQAAEELLSESPHNTILDDLSALVDKGLLQQTQRMGEPRFSMFVSIREFASELLAQDEQSVQVEEAYAAYFLKMAEESEAHLFDAQQSLYLARLAEEADNWRAVLRRSLERLDGETSARLAASLWRYWWLAGDVHEGVQWLEKSITLFRSQISNPPDSAQAQLLATSLLGAGILAIYQNEYQQATIALQEALAIARTLNDAPHIALAYHGLARMMMRLGQFDQAERAYIESVTLFRELNNDWGVAQALLYRGLTLWVAGDFEQAYQPLEESLALSRQIGDPQGTNQAMEALAWVKMALGQLSQAQELLESSVEMARIRNDRALLTRGLNGLGSTLRRRGQNSAAYIALAEAFLIAHELGDRWHIVGCLIELAFLMQAHGELVRAARSVGACEFIIPHIGTRAPAQFIPVYRELGTKLQRQMGEQAYQQALVEGAAVAQLNDLASWDSLIGDLPTTEPAPKAGSTQLTEREQEVLRYLAQGLTNMQIAERLVVSPFTINAHLRNIYNKLDLPSRPAAIRYALEHGMA